jgi:hypothetical protein
MVTTFHLSDMDGPAGLPMTSKQRDLSTLQRMVHVLAIYQHFNYQPLLPFVHTWLSSALEQMMPYAEIIRLTRLDALFLLCAKQFQKQEL